MDKLTQKLIDLIMEAKYIPFDDEKYVEPSVKMLADAYWNKIKDAVLSDLNDKIKEEIKHLTFN